MDLLDNIKDKHQMNAPNVFRTSKPLFYVNAVSSLVLCFVFIGIPILIVVVIKYMYTFVTVGDNGVEYRTGWLSTTHKQIPYDKINNVEVKIGLLGKWLGYGNIKLFTGNDVEGIKLAGIDRPNELRQQVEAHITQVRHGHTPLATTPIASMPQGGVADELAKLAKLKSQGAITSAEYAAKKKQLLDI